MEPIIAVAIIGFAGQIGTALIGVWLAHKNGLKIDDNTKVTHETHKIVNSQQTVMEQRIEMLEKMLAELRGT
jgi:hypothetical protein